MTLEHLWAGWRAPYVTSAGNGSVPLPAEPASSASAAGPGEMGGAAAGVASSGWEELLPAPAPGVAAGGPPAEPADGTAACVFCTIFESQLPDSERLVVFESEEIVVLMNAYPYATGHVMVMPRRHIRDLEELTAGEEAALWPTVRRAVAALKAAYRPDGFNLGVNLGRAAGAGIPGHLHVHAVPRWIGDTNFMTATAGTRVLPEPLGESWQKLRAAWR